MWTRRCWCPHWTAISIRDEWNDTWRSAGSPGRGGDRIEQRRILAKTPAKWPTEIDRVAIGTEVCVVSAKTGQGFGELGEFLRPDTLGAAGSSGVGKSTIANRLLGQVVQEVGPVREE